MTTMKFLKNIIWPGCKILVLWLALASCTEIEQIIPSAPIDTTSTELPFISASVLGIDSVEVDLSPSIVANEPFSVSFSSFQHGRMVLREGKKFRYISLTERWVADSGFYDICQTGNCKRGKIKVRNNRIFTDSVVISLPELSPYYIPYLGSQEVYLIPPGRSGKVISLSHNAFTASVIGPDSTRMVYFAASGISNPFLLGFDDVTFQIKTIGDTILKGSFKVILGDTCEAQARDNAFMLTGSNAEWNTMDWAANDEPCFAPLEDFKIKIHPSVYSNYIKVNTPQGILTDTLIGGEQKLLYKRTNPAATEDVFPYYLLANSTNRLSRAWIRIKFN